MKFCKDCKWHKKAQELKANESYYLDKNDINIFEDRCECLPMTIYRDGCEKACRFYENPELMEEYERKRHTTTDN